MAADFEFAAGLGTQYGVVGGQVVLNKDDSKYFVALGAAGVGLGFKTIVSENEHHSMGADIGTFDGLFSADYNYASVNYNYHFDGFHKKGWEIGTGIAYVQRDGYNVLFSGEYREEKKSAALVFNLGYTF